MAVFPDRIVLKNSTDNAAAITAAIESGGTDEIQQGELVIGRDNGSASLYTLDANGDVVEISGGGGGGSTTLEDLQDVNFSKTAPYHQDFEPGNTGDLSLGTSATISTNLPYSGTQSLTSTSTNFNFRTGAPLDQSKRFDTWTFMHHQSQTLSASYTHVLGGYTANVGTGALATDKAFALFNQYSSTVVRVPGSNSTASQAAYAGGSATTTMYGGRWYRYVVEVDWGAANAGGAYRKAAPSKIRIWIEGRLRFSTTNPLSTLTFLPEVGDLYLRWPSYSQGATTRYIDEIRFAQTDAAIFGSGEDHLTDARVVSAFEDLLVDDGQIIEYNSVVGAWENKDNSHVSRLAELGDVNVPEITDSNYGDVGLLLLGDGTPGAAELNDSGPLGLVPTTVVGEVSDNDSGPNGQTFFRSLAYNSGLRATYPINDAVNFGAGDFTIETNFYYTDDRLAYLFTAGRNTTDLSCKLLLTQGGSSPRQIQFRYTTDGATEVLLNYASALLEAGRWYHIAVVRSSGVLYMYLDGVQVATQAAAATFWTATTNFGVGCSISSGGTVGDNWYGGIQNFRITKGVARYTAPFTPPLNLGTGTATPDGYVLGWNSTDGAWEAVAGGGGGGQAYDVAMDGGDFDTGLTDDTTTIFDQFPISIDAHSDVDTTTTPPTNGQALVWNGVDNWVPGTVAASVALNDLTDVTITAAATGEVLRYNGSAWVDAQLAYSDLSGTPSLATVATTGAYADLTGKPTLATVATTGAYSDLTGKPTIPASIDDLTDVDTATAAPTVDQVLVWDGANWVPGNQTGGGGSSVSGTIIRKTESRTAASSAATFTDIGASGLLVSFHSDIDAWIVLYPTAADRAADAGRAYGADPAPGSGVLAEVFVAAGTTVLASPGTAYFNNDTTSSDAIYAAVRDQAGAAANATVTIVAYAHQTFAGIGTNRVSDSGTAAAGALDLTGLGQTGQLCTVTSSLDAWIVIYGSSADRTADAGRSFSTDPAPGSGVMAEFYIAAGMTILATPGTGYFNNDTTPADAIYLAVRNQAGAAVDSLVTITAYAETSYSGISGGTFGSG